jgi:hypothetical protein
VAPAAPPTTAPAGPPTTALAQPRQDRPWPRAHRWSGRTPKGAGPSPRRPTPGVIARLPLSGRLPYHTQNFAFARWFQADAEGRRQSVTRADPCPRRSGGTCARARLWRAHVSCRSSAAEANGPDRES